MSTDIKAFTAITVGHMVVRLRFTDLDRHGKDGEWLSYEQIIEIDRRLEGVELARVLLHELGHAILQAYVPVNTVVGGHPNGPEQLQETFVDAHAKGLLQVMRDNPELLAVLSAAMQTEREKMES